MKKRIKCFDLFLLQGLPYRNGEVDHKKLKFYNIIFMTMRILATTSFFLGFVIVASKVKQNNEFFSQLSSYAHFIGLIMFITFCVVFALSMLYFLSLKTQNKKQRLKLLTPYHQSKKIILLNFFQAFCILFFSVLFMILGFALYAGFFTFHIALLAIPKIRAIYTDGDLLYMDCVILEFVPLGLYPVKNDKDLYYCEFIFSQSTIPFKIQQIVRCECQGEYLIKRKAFGFAKNIDPKELIEILNHRVISQHKTPNAQDTKVKRIDYEKF